MSLDILQVCRAYLLAHPQVCRAYLLARLEYAEKTGGITLTAWYNGEAHNVLQGADKMSLDILQGMSQKLTYVSAPEGTHANQIVVHIRP